MAQIRWSLSAVRDLREIEEFIARDSIDYAVNFTDRLVQVAETVARRPRLGRVVPEFRRAELREVLFRSYRVIDLLEPRSRVVFLRVVHGARDLEELIAREPWELS